MNRPKSNGLMAVVAVLFIGTALFQSRILPLRPQFTGSSIIEGKKAQSMLALPSQMLGAAAIGFKEAMASVLWVRADEFFHEGNYDAIIPLVRMVTWLDPHQLDVYSTGAWHLDYNFTDSDNRSDRRYIAPAIALIKEGIANNPDIYDMYFELGWTHYYQKIKDYKSAAYWLEKASEKPGRDPVTGKVGERPMFVEHMLAHVFEQTGQYAKAEAVWNRLIRQTEVVLKKSPKDFEANQEASVCRKNLSSLLLRQGFRYGDMAAYRRGIEVGRAVPNPDKQLVAALDAVNAQYDSFTAQGRAPRDVAPPIDIQFTCRVSKKSPKVLVVEGTANMIPASYYKNLAVNTYTAPSGDVKKDWINYGKLYITLADADYKPGDLKEFSWSVDPNQTILITDTQVHEGKFMTTIDMSKDPKQYPLAKSKYKLTVLFDPRLAPEEIQDRIGWLGEGITDKNYLDTTSVPGVKMVKFEKVLDRKDIL